MPQSPTAQAAALSSRFLFILLGALAGLTPLAVDMYLPAIPAIARDLATSIDGAQLTISAFLGGFAIGQLFYGPLADSYGRKPVILAGLVMFAIASVGCAMADSLPELLAYRMLQAAGGAAGLPPTSSPSTRCSCCGEPGEPDPPGRVAPATI